MFFQIIVTLLSGIYGGDILCRSYETFFSTLEKKWCNECFEFLDSKGIKIERKKITHQPNPKINHKQVVLIQLRIIVLIILSMYAAHLDMEQSKDLIKMVCIALLVPCLLFLWMIDFKHLIIPDEIVMPLLWTGLAMNYFSIFIDLESAFIGCVLGYMILKIPAVAFFLIRKKEGMGSGDFTLLAMMGAWLGWQAVLFILLFATVSGSIIGGLLLYTKKIEGDFQMPFGPHLINGFFVYLIVGKWLIQWYLSFI